MWCYPSLCVVAEFASLPSLHMLHYGFLSFHILFHLPQHATKETIALLFIIEDYYVYIFIKNVNLLLKLSYFQMLLKSTLLPYTTRAHGIQ